MTVLSPATLCRSLLLPLAVLGSGCRALPPPVTVAAGTGPVSQASAEVVAGGRQDAAVEAELQAGPLDRWPDVETFVDRLGADLRGISHWENAAAIGLAAGAAVLVRQDLDGEVRERTRGRSPRWGRFSRGLGYLGNAEVQIPILLGSALYARRHGDAASVAMHRSLVEAYTLTSLGTLLVKAIANTDRPSDDWNGGQYGFPSYHAASSFTVAAVLQEHYGPRAGVPAAVVAGLISFSRIDERAHDLSDVLFGAATGWIVGRSVSRGHLHGDGRLRLLPWRDEENESVGLRWLLEF